MWIKVCRELYEESVERITGKLPNPTLLEQELERAKEKKQVGPGELKIIEKGDYWPYPEWWPKLSEQFGEPITLPRRLDSHARKKETVNMLQKRLKHIEVVSIILRFIFPEKFGIISPPVIGLLNLVPVPDKDYAGQYLCYLEVLGELRQRYRSKLEFGRIADFDMALWTAAHLQLTRHKAIRDEMYQDDDFQEIRLRNLLKGLGKRWSGTLRERLLLAGVLLRHDPAAGAVIVARCYEKIIWEVGKQFGIYFSIGKHDSKKTRQKLADLAECSEVSRRGVSSVYLNYLYKFRNYAVHGVTNPKTGESKEISKNKAKNFLEGVEKLKKDLEELLP